MANNAPDFDPIADLLADAIDLDDILPKPPVEDPLTDLDALLASLDDTSEAAVADDSWLADLDDLLGPSAAPTANAGTDLDDLDNLLSAVLDAPEGDNDPMALLDSLLGGGAPVPKKQRDHPFGTITAAAPSSQALARPTFRMAVFGDFSGRAARGLIEIGPALAARRAIPLDIDTLDSVIEGFATTLVLPIGKDAAGIEVRLNEIDDLHPDQLIRNLPLFQAFANLRQRLSQPATAAEMQGWAASFPDLPAATRGLSTANAIPADRKLSEFQKLIGDREGRLTQASPIDDLLARIVGPHVVHAPDAQTDALRDSVDRALASALRLVLHHPEFQTIEAHWRGLDMLARRIETDVDLQITLYDVSAEELAVDLAMHHDLSRTGLFKLLNKPLMEEGESGFSAIFGLYTFEETPPHAELLARVAQIAAHVRAPFLTALSPGFMATELKDRHPLVSRAWEALASHPAAAYLGLTTPRVLMRRPYGAKSDPIDSFGFEEFGASEGLRGLLWANPVLVTAVLMAQTAKESGKQMDLGSIMSLDEMPFHYVKDRHGDQVALPCTERNLTEDRARRAMDRGLMPLIWIKGRDVVRLGSFHSLAGGIIRGPWSDQPEAQLKPEEKKHMYSWEIAAAEQAASEAAAEPEPEKAAPVYQSYDASSSGQDLEALLAGFGDTPVAVDPDAIDAELAALLEGL